MAKKSTEPRVALITRTVTTNYHYKFFTFDNGVTELIGEDDRKVKVKQSELSAMSKEHGKTVIAVIASSEEQYLGITVEQFMQIAKPVKNGKLVD